MSARKPIDQIRGHRTRAEIAVRLEPKPSLPGMPPMPVGMDRETRKHWHKWASKYLNDGLLRTDDADLLISLVTAEISGNKSEKRRILREFKKRQPAAPPETPAPPAEEPAAENPEAAPAPDCAAIARQYATDITSGAIVAGKFVKLACQRFLDDLEKGAERGITFDPAACQRVVDYLNRLKLGTLLGWQCFVLANLFGFKRANGLRRFRNAYVEVAKKNGKSSLLAGLGLYMADPEGDQEPRATSYMAATTRYQSQSICFKEAVRLRNANEDLSMRTEAFKTAIVWNESSLEPLAANSDKLNGLNIQFGILDELGDHPTPDLFNVFSSSMVGRKQPLLLSITTAGKDREQIAYYQRQHGAQVLEGVIEDDRFFVYIAELDEADDPFDEKVWIKANPSLDVLVPLENLRAAAASARAIPSMRQDFCRYHLDLWPSTSSTGWIDVNDLSKQGNRAISAEEMPLSAADRIAKAEARLKGRPCIAGLDLALVSDLSALCLLFPPLEETGIFECLFRVWAPEENIVRRTKEQRVPYTAWRDQKFLIATPGETTDFKFIREETLALRDKFHISELGFDVHLAEDLVSDLRHEGLEVTQVSQGFKLDPAIRRIERLIKQQKFCLHGHPIAEWCFSNVVLDHGVREVRLEKRKSREKIDVATAAVIAMDTFLSTPPKPVNPYLTRGIIFIDDIAAPAKQVDEDPEG
jgi:phage terminase large subunit-like protein